MGHQEFNDLETAIRVFEKNMNMARISPALHRIVDSDDNVIKYYDPATGELQRKNFTKP